MKTRYAIHLAYDGTDYCGWQIQRGVGKHENSKPSIEGALVEAIRELCGVVVTVSSSGRTDAGVHASGQVAHFDLDQSLTSVPPGNLLAGLNDRLPNTIRILSLSPATEGFSARHAVRKQYSYFYQQGPANLPHLKNYTAWSRRTLNVEKMHEALQFLIGRHDFAAFCGAGAQVSSTVREVFEAEVSEDAIPLPGCSTAGGTHSLIRIRLVGSGFLKQMVRRVAGTLQKIGDGRLPPEEMAGILESGDRDRSGPTARPNGLWLDHVWYPDDCGVNFLSND